VVRRAPVQERQGACAVDYRGSDPTPENDSAGEFVWLVGEVFRYEHDARCSSAYGERARGDGLPGGPASERSARRRTGIRRAPRTSGLLPPSISHEGYSAKPAYSYWTISGATPLSLGTCRSRRRSARNRRPAEYARQRDEFEHELVASIRASAAQHHVDFLPGAADLGDFDATSSTIAFAPAGIAHRLPQDQVARTFERYWDEFVARRDGAKAWDAYTPYEWATSEASCGWDGAIAPRT
jgi:hypothetical protein